MMSHEWNTIAIKRPNKNERPKTIALQKTSENMNGFIVPNNIQLRQIIMKYGKT